MPAVPPVSSVQSPCRRRRSGQLFELANTSPSASNTQPWLVEARKRRRKGQTRPGPAGRSGTGPKSQDFPYDPSVLLRGAHRPRQETGALIYQALGIARDDKAARQQQFLSNLSFFGAPHVALMFLPANANTLMINDLGMYTQNLLLALTANGVASCTQAIIAWFAEAARTSLGITDPELMYGVSFGYADENAPINQVRTPRAPLADFGRFWN